METRRKGKKRMKIDSPVTAKVTIITPQMAEE